MLRLALKNVRHNPKRLILTSIAVTLGVTLVSATFVLTSAAQLGIGDLNEAYYGSGRVVVTPDPDFEGDPDIPLLTDETVEALRGLPGVAEVEPRIDASGDAPLLGSDGKPFSGAPTIVWNWSDNPEVSRATVVDGRALTRTGEILVDVRTFESGSWELGDTLELATFSGIEDYTLVGVVRFGEQNILQGAALVYLSLEDAGAVRVGDGGYDRIDIVPEAGVDHTILVEPASGVLPLGARATTSEFLVEEMDDQVADIMGIIDVVVLVFAFVSVFVGAYIIVNTFRIIVTQRTREIGLLRAVAASGAQVRRMILIEASIISSVASAIGIGLGWLLAFGLLKLMESSFGNTYNSVPLPLDAILLGLLVGFGVTLGSAMLPAIHASRIHPMEAIRESGTHSRKPVRLRTLVGLALTVAATVLIVVGLIDRGEDSMAWVALGAILVILGVTLLAPSLLVILASRLRRPFSRFRVTGTLATNNIRREPRRSANTATALMIGVLLMSLMAVILSSIRIYAQERVSSDVRADLYISSSQINLASGPVVSPEAYENIRDTPGIAETMRWGFGSAWLDGTQYRVGAVDSAVADDMYFFDATPSIELIGEGVFIGPALQDLGYEVGDVILLDGPVSDRALTITGEFEGAIGDALLVDWLTAEALFGSVETISVLAIVEGDPDEVRAGLDDALADFPLIESYDRDDLLGMANDLVTVVLVLVSALLGGALIIALLGIANTLMLSVTERTREIGLLRAVGLSRREVRRMIILESLIIALFGSALGILLGAGLGSAPVAALRDWGFTTLSVPWLLLGLYFILAILAGVVAAAWPARRAAKLDILGSITTE
ncbi:MAG: FtsX-like permease family protein [Demequinaceae bacterium]|nr:FtsX-like permease family protein [Demequinaceae bacterium]